MKLHFYNNQEETVPCAGNTLVCANPRVFIIELLPELMDKLQI